MSIDFRFFTCEIFVIYIDCFEKVIMLEKEILVRFKEDSKGDLGNTDSNFKNVSRVYLIDLFCFLVDGLFLYLFCFGLYYFEL